MFNPTNINENIIKKYEGGRQKRWKYNRKKDMGASIFAKKRGIYL